ncbi:MAG: insulinase family protein [Chloroflexi bacterium]|nr:insulinase family protein [Chloroflexota bacterium]
MPAALTAVQRTLSNGVHLVATPVPHTAAVSLYVASRAGSGSEPVELSGVTHFVEHMLFRHGSHEPGAFACAIERLGGQINAATEPELTAVGAKVPSEAWNDALQIVARMVHEPTMDPDEIEKERTVILDELALLDDLPEESARRSVLARLWPNHPFGREIAGTATTVRALTRDALLRRAVEMFAGRNTIVSVAGALDPSAVLDVLADVFGSVPAGSREAYPVFHANGQESGRVQVIRREAEQAYFSIAGFTPGRASRDRYAIELLAAVLGAGFGARLVLELRERHGLAYDVSAELGYCGKHGVLSIDGATDPDDLTRAVAIVLGELSDVADRGVTEEEFERARAYTVGGLVRSLEDSAVVAAWHAREQALEPSPLPPDALIDRVRTVARSDVTASAQACLAPSWPLIAVAGPLSDNTDIPTELVGSGGG